MEKLRRIFDSFSRRNPNRPTHEIPSTFRYRLLQWLSEDFFDVNPTSEKRDFMLRLHADLRMRHGHGQLSPQSRDEIEDVVLFWNSCTSEQFLEIVEDTCRIAYEHGPFFEPDTFTGSINQLLNEDSLPFALTKFRIEKTPSDRFVGKFDFQIPGGTVRTVTAFPQIILREEEFTHRGAIEPVLDLLAGSAFKTANEEFREALQHYRKAEYGDCLTKCGNALESVMKIICTRKGWPYDPNKSTARPLLDTILSKTTLDSYFQDPLLIVATVRNRLSKSHGAGPAPRTPTRQVARYALNSTASAILLLAEETGEI